MTDVAQPTSRETLDRIIQQTIITYRWAVLASFALIGIGFLIATIADQNVDTEMASPVALFHQVVDVQASGFFGLGIAVMVVTPIVMIGAAAFRFMASGDRRYALITMAVAIILSLSIAISFVIG